MLSWGLVARVTCSPLSRFSWIFVVWALLWVWLLVGAAIFQAIENPTRREPEATAFLQGEINYSEAVYFTAVYVTTCGLGDIVPVTDGGRALVCVWSFFGTAIWLVLLTSIVGFMCDFVYVEVILNSYWYLRRRRLRASRRRDSSSRLGQGANDIELAVVGAASGRRPESGGREDGDGDGDDGEHKTSREHAKDEEDGHQAVEEEGDDDGDGDEDDTDSSDEDDDDDLDNDDDDGEEMKKKAEGDAKRAQGKNEKEKDQKGKADGVGGKSAKEEEEEKAPTWKEHAKEMSLGDALLSWRSLLILNAVALTLYFVVQIICTGVLLELEPQMGWLNDNLTPHSFATYFYASFTYSQTICFGTDYAPKTPSGRAFFVVWQQLNFIVATFLFSTVAMAIIRYSKHQIAFVLERVMVRTYGPRFRARLRRVTLTPSRRRASSASDV